MTLAHWLHRTAQAHPELPATAIGPTPFATYAQLARRAAGLARRLRELGLRRGEAVAIHAGSAPEYFEALYGCWWGGYVAAVVEPGFRGATLAAAIARSGARVCFVEPRLGADALLSMPPPAPLFLPFGGPEYRAAAEREPAPIAAVTATAPAMIYFGAAPDGGAAPLGATLTHRGVANLALALLADVDPVTPRDAQIHATPATLQSGLLGVPTIARGGVNVMPESGGFDAAEIFELATRWGRASLFATPPGLAALARATAEVDQRVFRSILVGGAPAPRQDLAAALNRFGARITQVYGVKEMPLGLTRLSRYDIAARSEPAWLPRISTIGRAYLTTDIRIAGAKGEELSVGRVGEIWARGPMRMAHYWRDKAATTARLSGGWLKTGLYGAMDAGGWIALKTDLRDQPTRGAARLPYRLESEQILRDILPEADDLALVRADVGASVDFDLAFSGALGVAEVRARVAGAVERVGRIGAVAALDGIPRDGEGRVRAACVQAAVAGAGVAAVEPVGAHKSLARS